MALNVLFLVDLLLTAVIFGRMVRPGRVVVEKSWVSPESFVPVYNDAKQQQLAVVK